MFNRIEELAREYVPRVTDMARRVVREIRTPTTSTGLSLDQRLARVQSAHLQTVATILEASGSAPLTLEVHESRGPKGKEYLDAPVGYTVSWNSTSIQTALTSHHQGQFHQSGYLIESMFSDARIITALNGRIKGITGCKPYLLASKKVKDKKKAQYVADELSELYAEILPTELVEQIWTWAPMEGWTLCNQTWETEEDRWIPRLRFWHPINTFFLNAGALEDRKFQAVTMGDGNVPITKGDPAWFLFTPFGEYRGWLKGAVRQCGIPWVVRNYCLRDWARASEVHGLAQRVIKVPANAIEEDKARLANKVANLTSESTFVLPVNADGSGFDISLLEAKNRIFEVFEHLGWRCDSDITLAIRGTQLMEAMGETSGSGHSNAASQSVRAEDSDYAQSDAKKFAPAVRNQVFRPYCRYNHGDPNLAPDLVLSSEPPEDLSRDAKCWLDLSTANLQFLDGGVKLDWDEVGERYKVPISEVGEPPPRDGSGEGSEPKLQPLSGDGGENNKVPLGHAKRRRSTRVPRRPAEDGQAYVDAVHNHARGEAVALMRPYLNEVQAAVRNAQSPAELKQALKRIARDVSRGSLYELATASRLMADLAGRHTVIEETASKK
jgi:hypothetical protein